MTDLAFSLDRHYTADPQRVWAHFTEPDLMATWFCPNPALETTCTLDVRPGGAWTCDMGGQYAVSGTFTEVEAPSRLVFTMDWAHDDDPPTTVTVTITPDDDGTRLVLAHEGSGHQEGWTLSLARLATELG